MTTLIGTKIGGRYEITRLLGEGGMAEVYEATQALINRRVAVKLMHRHLSNDAQFKARFEREAQAIAQLKHPHIIQLYDFEFDNNLRQYYMVIEYIDGPTLSDYIKANPQLPLSQVLKIVEDTADALGYAHARQMQHRDIKPSNIMLDGETRTVLTDFGIAKLVQDAGQQLTASGAMVGTPAYISPEQAAGIPGDHRSDIYSLGIVFYQLATGRLPYQGDTPIATILKHIKEVPPSPTSINPTLPLGVETVILRCLAKEADDRYQSTAELLQHLRDLEAAATELDNVRTISGKVLSDAVFSSTPTPATRLNRTPTPFPSSSPQLTDTITIAPRHTSLLIGAGAIAIIALLTLGAFLFSTAGNNGANDATPCVLVLADDLAGRAEANLESPANIILEANTSITILKQEADFLQVEDANQSAWVEKTALAVPSDCELP